MTTRTTIRRRRVRMFAIVWSAITLFMGVITFVAIYMIYGVATSPRNNLTDTGSLALPVATTANQAAVLPAVSFPTALPTQERQPPTATVEQEQSVAQAATSEPATAAPTTVLATPLPVDQQFFQVGTQVQVSPDLNPENQELWMREVRDKLGLNWYKQQVRWEDVEPERGQFNWAALDLSLPLAADYGLKVALSVVTAPDWAREQGVNLDQHGPPADSADYANFVTTMMERYPGMIHAIEVWNEQNLDREWTSTRGLSAANYVELLRTTAQAVKQVDPGVIIISGALSPTGGWTEPDGRVSALDDFVYLDQLIAAGMLNYTDCVGVHHNGYNIGPSVAWNNVANDPNASFRGPFDNPHHSWSFYSTVRTYADKIELDGSDQPLCITEFGWASTEDLEGFPPGFEFANDNTLEEQAEWTIEALDNMREWGTVWLAFIWNFNYAPQAGWEPTNDNVPYSMIGKDWNFRPIYDAVAEWQREYEEQLNQ
jgi:polysaccharide biosynthesis protein PslG